MEAAIQSAPKRIDIFAQPVLREKTQALLADATARDDCDELLEKGGAFIRSFAEGKRV